MGSISIGNKVTISHRAILNTHTNAGKSPVAHSTLKKSIGNIKINDGAYLGSNVTVLESVDIGSNTIIGAKSLVNKDISDGFTAFGVPCKVRENNK
jgi:acetyltransferase-like isoleucine patch superfamily enzyme